MAARFRRDAANRARRPLAALAALIAMLGPASAWAQAALDSDAVRDRIHEARFSLDIHLDGPIAAVTATQTLVNPGKHDHEAVYRFELPADAAIVGLAVEHPGAGKSADTIIDAGAAVDPLGDADALDASADRGLLRLIGRDPPGGPEAQRRARYELHAYPIPAGGTATVTLRWVAPLRYQDGRLLLRIPDRGVDAALVREHVTVTVGAGLPGPTTLHGGGTLLAERAQPGKAYRVLARPGGDLVVEAAMTRPGQQPLVQWAQVPLAPDMGVVAIAGMAPRPAARERQLPYERAVLVIDVSRSLGREGLHAARTMADAFLALLPARARVEVVLFDRTARRVLGTLEENRHGVRKRVADAIAGAPLDNGSQLGLALDEVRTLLARDRLDRAPAEGTERGGRASTLLAVISDGMTPVDLDETSAASRLGKDILADSDLHAVTLVPDGAPIPDGDSGVLPHLAHLTPGRALAVRHGETRARAKNLAAELGEAAPVTDLTLDFGGADVVVEPLLGPLDAGGGFWRVGYYYGRAPQRVALTGRASGKDVRIAGKSSAPLRRHAAALGVSAAVVEDFLPRTEQLRADGSLEEHPQDVRDRARRALIASARAAPAVTRHSALVAVDGSDRFARERLAMTKKWGPAVFFRMPPPPERAALVAMTEYRDGPTSASAVAGTSYRDVTGTLDGTVIRRMLRRHVMPGARACYERALRRDHAAAGTVTVTVEIARGEIQAAAIDRSSITVEGFEACVLEAAYSIHAPRVKLGDDPEVVSVARYPMTFRPSKQSGVQVEVGDEREAPAEIDYDDPLGGLREKNR